MNDEEEKEKFILSESSISHLVEPEDIILSTESPKLRSRSNRSYCSNGESQIDPVEYDVATRIWDGRWHLVAHSKLPTWLQDNDYLVNWHRPSVPSFSYCFSSIFRWHTETGNIWTHLIGGLIFIGLTLYYLLLPNMRFTEAKDHVKKSKKHQLKKNVYSLYSFYQPSYVSSFQPYFIHWDVILLVFFTFLGNWIILVLHF